MISRFVAIPNLVVVWDWCRFVLFVVVARFVASVSGLLRASIAVCVAARGDSVFSY